jgi:fumarate reductase subunit D
MLPQYLKTFWVLFEGIELIRLSIMWSTIIIFAANFVAGWLLTHGYIDPADHNATAQGIADALGYIILATTSIFSLVHAFKHPHGVTSQQPITTTAVKTETKTEAVFTEGFSQDPGTPPASSLPPTVQ